MSKYLVKTDVLFLTDTVSVKKGVFDSKDVPVDQGIIEDKCKFHPRDIERVSDDSVANSKIEKGGKEVKPEKKEDPKKPADPAKGEPDKGADAGADAGKGSSEDGPKAQEDISVNEIKSILKEKKVEFDPKANKDTLYGLYVKAHNTK